MTRPIENAVIPAWTCSASSPEAASGGRQADLFGLLPLATRQIPDERGIRTVIVSGAETDVCVLSAVLDAVNIGFRVVLVEGALCSSSDNGHDALMTMYRLRLSEQIDLVTAEGLRESWRRE